MTRKGSGLLDPGSAVPGWGKRNKGKGRGEMHRAERKLCHRRSFPGFTVVISKVGNGSRGLGRAEEMGSEV